MNSYKIVCIKVPEGYTRELTFGKIYTLQSISIFSNCHYVINDEDQYGYYYTTCFMPLILYRAETLKLLLNNE
jgi:hypothetical protein